MAVGAVIWMLPFESGTGAVSEIVGGVPLGLLTTKVAGALVPMFMLTSLAVAVTVELPAVFMVMTAWPLLSIGKLVPPTVNVKLLARTPTLSLANTRKVTLVPVVTVVAGLICTSTVGGVVSAETMMLIGWAGDETL